MRVCSDVRVARVAHTCRSLACVRLFPRDGRCRHCTSFAPPERAGGAYMPPFGMCAAIAHRGPCPHCTSFADITRRRLRARVAHTCRRLACVRLLRTADDALIARRSFAAITRRPLRHPVAGAMNEREDAGKAKGTFLSWGLFY